MELSRIDFALMKVLQSRNCTAYFSGMTMQELISVVRISRSAAYRRLNRLITEGYIEKACKSINADTFCMITFVQWWVEGLRKHVTSGNKNRRYFETKLFKIEFIYLD